MTWREAITLALRSVARRSGRVLLTVLAVVLAAALLIALLTIATTAKSRVLGQITKGGPLAGITMDGPNLDREAIRRIEGVPDVVAVAPVVAVQQLVIAPDPPIFGSGGTASLDPFPEGVVGVDLAHAERFPISIIAGRLPGPDSATEVAVTEGYLTRVGLDRTAAARVLGTEVELGIGTVSSFVVVGGMAVEELRPGVPIGAAGRWTRATVVGVVAQDAGPGDLLVPIGQIDAAWDSVRAGDPPFAALMVQARKLGDVSAVRERIGALGYDTIASETLLTNVVRYVHVVEIVLSGIGPHRAGDRGPGHRQRHAGRSPRAPPRDRRAQGHRGA